MSELSQPRILASDIANGTSSDPVYREDGQRLYGLDADTERKMQEKREDSAEFEGELIAWIESAIKCELEFPGDLIESLRSGEVLCKLVNTIQPDTIKIKATKQPKSPRAVNLVEMDNIRLYLEACSKLGVPNSELFVVSDLYDRKGTNQVIVNIGSLARRAHNFKSFDGPDFRLKYSPKSPNKRWEVKSAPSPILVTDLEAAGPSEAGEVSQLRRENAALKKQLRELSAHNARMTAQIKARSSHEAAASTESTEREVKDTTNIIAGNSSIETGAISHNRIEALSHHSIMAWSRSKRTFFIGSSMLIGLFSLYWVTRRRVIVA